MRTPRLLSLIVSAALGMGLIGIAPTGAVMAEKRATPNRGQDTSVLFALSATVGTVVRRGDKPRRYRLTLQGTDARTVWFADRPARDAGTLRTRALVRRWSAFGFTKTPPNVALTLKDPAGEMDTVVAVMRNPSWRAGRLTARIRVLTVEKARNVTGNLARHGNRHDGGALPRDLGAVSLFIDDGGLPACTTGQWCMPCDPDSACWRAGNIDKVRPGLSLPGVDWRHWYLLEADLSDGDFTGANMSRAFLNGTDLSRAKLMRATIQNAELSFAHLSGADLSGADLSGSLLYRTNLTGANLTGANLSRAVLINADLTGANLTGAILTEADMQQAILRDADLTRASFAAGDLTRADLTHATITDTDFGGTYLIGAIWIDGRRCALASLGMCN